MYESFRMRYQTFRIDLRYTELTDGQVDTGSKT